MNAAYQMLVMHAKRSVTVTFCNSGLLSHSSLEDLSIITNGIGINMP